MSSNVDMNDNNREENLSPKWEMIRETYDKLSDNEKNEFYNAFIKVTNKEPLPKDDNDIKKFVAMGFLKKNTESKDPNLFYYELTDLGELLRGRLFNKIKF